MYFFNIYIQGILAALWWWCQLTGLVWSWLVVWVSMHVLFVFTWVSFRFFSFPSPPKYMHVDGLVLLNYERVHECVRMDVCTQDPPWPWIKHLLMNGWMNAWMKEYLLYFVPLIAVCQFYPVYLPLYMKAAFFIEKKNINHTLKNADELR